MSTAAANSPLPEFTNDPTPARQELEIYHVPRADLPRAPGYSETGVYLPLSEIQRLAKASDARTSSPAHGTASCMVESLKLSGTIGKQDLQLEGTLAFRSSGTGWCATLVDDGNIRWMSSAGPSGMEAYLVRVNARTYLMTKGGISGTLNLRALVKMPADHLDARLNFGRFYAPATIQLTTPPGLEASSSNAPLEKSTSGSATVLTFWPGQDQGTRLHLQQAAEIQAPSSLRVELTRTVMPAGNILSVSDALLLHDRFASGTTLQLPLPDGLQLLTAETTSSARVTVTSGMVSLIFTEPLTRLPLKIVTQTAAGNTPVEAAGASHRLNSWQLKPVAQVNTVILRSMERYTPMALNLPDGFKPVHAREAETRYEYAGVLPALEISIVPVAPPAALNATADIHLTSREASVRYEISNPPLIENSLQLSIPPDWVLTHSEWSLPDSTSGTCVIQPQSDEKFRLVWNADIQPAAVRFELHRVGPWGAPGTSIDVAAPVIRVNGKIPHPCELNVNWPSELDVRATDLRDLKIVPSHSESANVNPQADVSNVRLRLRVVGQEASGKLRVKAHASDVQGTVVTYFSVDEEQAIVRALMRFDVRFAPAHTFRFTLPQGTGGAIRIQGEGIRESTHRSTETGDEWTVITQNAILGTYDISLEWPLPEKTLGKPVVVPEIRLTGVSTQKGFVVLEGSSALRLTAETDNLSETDPSEVPDVPWSRDNRTLAVYRYIEPPYYLKVQAEKFVPEPALEGLVREAELLTSVAFEGERLTRARYTLAPMSDRQFFELRLPHGAQLWSAMVNNDGVKPARRAASKGEPFLMVPLPASTAGTDMNISLVYREDDKPLNSQSRVELTGPRIEAPVNRTVWHLSLPKGFEYLAYGGTFQETAVVREPLARFVRTAYYPDRLVLTDWSITGILVVTGIALFFGSILIVRRNIRRTAMQSLSSSATGSETALKPQTSGCLSSFGSLIVVVAIIAILSAIAVPNFLEAQVRSKVSRVKADMRSLATAIESYYVDNNQYPHELPILWQGSVKYSSGGFLDPTASDRSTPMQYLTGEEAKKRAVQAGMISPDTRSDSFWITYSVGPDGRDDGGAVQYDPTNGTVSAGDVIRTKDGQTSFDPQYKQISDKDSSKYNRLKMEVRGPAPEKEDAPAREEKSGVQFDSSKAQTSPPVISGLPDVTIGDAEAVDKTGKADANFFQFSDKFEFAEKDAVGKSAGQASASAPASNVPQDALLPSLSSVAEPVGGIAGGKPASPKPDARRNLAAARQAGLLSLGIQVPEGRLQRKFEGLTGDARIEIRLLESKHFERLRFCVWIASLLLMTGFYFLSRHLYRVLFLLAAGVTLFVPLLLNSSWTAFFNSAFQGVVFSLVVPVLYRSVRRYLMPNLLPATGAVVLALFLCPVCSYATEPAHTIALVPYDGDDPLTSATDPLAFISRSDFTQLWNQQNGIFGNEELTTAAITAFNLSGRFVSDESRVIGTLRAGAVNPAPVPAIIPLSLPGVSLTSIAFNTRGAGIANSADGLTLQLPANWGGELNATFEISVKASGSSGQMVTQLPAIAAGQWDITLPWKQAEVKSSMPYVTETSGTTMVLRGATRPGKFNLSWIADARIRDRNTGSTGGTLRADLNTTVTFANLAAGQWQSSVSLKADNDSLLPDVLQLAIPPNLHIYHAQGEKLISAEIDGSSLTLRLTSAASATITLQGVITSQAQDWQISALQFSESVSAQESLSIRLAKSIEQVSAQTSTLQRRSEQSTDGNQSRLEYLASGNSWQLALTLREMRREFASDISELFVPQDGLLRYAAHVHVTPRNGELLELLLDIPRDMKVHSLAGDHNPNWVQHAGTVRVVFAKPVTGSINLALAAESEFTSSDTLRLVPVQLRGSTDGTRTAAVLADAGIELSELEMNKANPRAPDERETSLIETLKQGNLLEDSILRAYTLNSPMPITLRLQESESRAIVSVFNKVTLSEGLQTLDATIRAEPRRGRLHEVEVILVSGIADPAASSRIRSTGPVRQLRTEQLDDRTIRVTAELNEPQKDTVLFNLLMEQAARVTDKVPVTATIVRPAKEDSGGRVLLLVRRELEGDLTLTGNPAVQKLDPHELKRLNWDVQTQPSDMALDISTKTTGNPAFQITRHTRQEALRAVVEVLRQRTIITADGFKRNELEIALQNRSEQFLKIALPYARKDVRVYEVHVAGRSVKPAFSSEGGRDVLLIPLIRTGLLEPELTVRVVYTVVGGKELRGSGRIAEQLPDILGNIPVAQSALVLMLPEAYTYSDYSGSLNRVELVDLEIDEAVRQTKAVEKLSEAALHTKGETQKKALFALSNYRTRVSSKIQSAKSQSEAYSRNPQSDAPANDAREARLAGERSFNLDAAVKAEQNIYSNVGRLDQLVQVQEQQVQQQKRASQVTDWPQPQQASAAAPVQAPAPAIATPTPAPPAAQITFPRSGNVLVFRQLQGTGNISFRYISRTWFDKLYDAGVAAAALGLIAIMLFLPRLFFSSTRRIALVAMLFSLAAILFQVALDLTIPLFAVSGIYFLMAKKRSEPESAAPDLPLNL